MPKLTEAVDMAEGAYAMYRGSLPKAQFKSMPHWQDLTAEEREACAAVAGTMAERTYDVEPEFSACLAIKAAIRSRGTG